MFGILVSIVEQSLGNEWFARIKRENTPHQILLHFQCPFSTWKSKFIGIYLNELQLLRISQFYRTFCNFNTKFRKLQKTLFNWTLNRFNVCMYMYLSISHHMKYIYIYICYTFIFIYMYIYLFIYISPIQHIYNISIYVYIYLSTIYQSIYMSVYIAFHHLKRNLTSIKMTAMKNNT